MTSRLLPVIHLFLLGVLAAAEPLPLEPPPLVLPPEVHEIAPTDVERYLVDHLDTVIIDVRTEQERKSRGHILNSLHHDFFHVRKDTAALAKLDKAKPCIIYDAIGGRAKLVAIEMHKLGFTNLLLLKGGFNAWTAAGQAVAR